MIIENIKLPRFQKRHQLAWFDILILTVILWGEAIYTSTAAYYWLLTGANTIEDNLVFTPADNYLALAQQAGLLLAALLYLRLRQFDFSKWSIRFNMKSIVCGGMIFVCGALLFDVYSLAVGPLAETLPIPGPIGSFFGKERVSDVIYALLNGVYEELYFLGICLAAPPKQQKWAVPFSLLIRFSFHTYQGVLSALGIGLLFGGFMYLLYSHSKSKNLLPFFVAHALGDVFGLGILHLFFQ